jgi:phosphoserine/homoserine phosphotransferase
MMERRAAVLRQNNIKLQQLFKLVEKLEPLDGAKDFLQWLKPIVPRAFLVTDIFEEYAEAMCEKLGHPMVFCNFLEADKEGFLARSVVRMRKPAGWGSTSSFQKTKAVEEFQRLNFRIIAVGSSFNDIGMLKAAEEGMFFNPSENLSLAHPDISTVKGYDALKKKISEIVARR